MKQPTRALASLLVLLWPLSLSAFESVKRPILYPNAHYEVMGKATAQKDIEDCWVLARDAGASENSDDQVSQDAASNAAALAFASAAAAAALGGDPHRAAVAGATGGAAASFAAGMVYQNDPPPVFRGIVERCLFEKGYEVAGWE
jgi:outer membrane lipoprotein SlyB